MLESITQITTCTGVSIRSHAEGTRISALTLSRKGKQLHLGKKIKDKTKLSELLAELPKGSTISLNISGKGMVYKESPHADSKDPALYSKLMPGAAAEDFYMQYFQSGERHFYSFIRRSEADPYIRQLNDNGYEVVMMSIGPFPVDRVLEQLNQYGEEFIFDGHEIRFDEQKNWQQYRFRAGQANRFPIKLGIESIDEQLLVPYAAAFQAILYHQIDPVETEAPPAKAAMQKNRQRGLLKKKGIIVLAAAFLLLFVNTMLFMDLNTENGRLQDQLSVHSTQTSDINELAEKNAKAEGLVKSIGYFKGMPRALMMDRIAALMPKDITLSAVDINPLRNRRQAQPSGSFTDNKISISGRCSSILPVNEWLARLQSLKWVKHAELGDYGLSNEEEKENGTFTIYINF